MICILPPTTFDEMKAFAGIQNLLYLYMHTNLDIIIDINMCLCMHICVYE
jgi:hypothetical protein